MTPPTNDLQPSRNSKTRGEKPGNNFTACIAANNS